MSGLAPNCHFKKSKQYSKSCKCCLIRFYKLSTCQSIVLVLTLNIFSHYSNLLSEKAYNMTTQVGQRAHTLVAIFRRRNTKVVDYVPNTLNVINGIIVYRVIGNHMHVS